MKSFLWGSLLVVVVVIAGLVYRNAAEHPSQPIACPLDSLVCPDGTSVARTGTSCTFSPCLLPNVSFTDVGIAFAIPAGFSVGEYSDAVSIASYDNHEASSTNVANIIIRRYSIAASSTPLATIQQTAINNTSGLPVSTTQYSSTVIGNHRFTVVSIDRFEGVIDTAYYLARTTDVLRFDAIDTNTDWTNPNLDTSKLPARTALTKLLSTLQGD